MNINFSIVFKTIGVVLAVIGLFQTIPFITSLIYREEDWHVFVYSAMLCIGCGVPLYFLRVGKVKLAKREGYLIVAIGWLGLCFFGSLPYLLADLNLDFSDAFFESTSGFTTTGASIFNDIEALPKSILVWRSLTQWIGGMGIIVLTVALFPILGIGGVELFIAEAPGPTNQKIHPKIKEVAKRLWLIYVGLTLLLMLLLKKLGGMNLFDSFNHALTTMATGGFSTKNASIAHFDCSSVEYIIMLFMLVGGVNYTILYYMFKRNWARVLKSEEFRFYLAIVSSLILFGTLYLYGYYDMGLEEAFRVFGFQTISLITTTGFISADYTAWGVSMTLLFFILLFVGGCAGSTSGGIKIIRHLVFLKNCLMEFKRILHPRAFIRMKVDRELVPGRVMTHILVFLLFYLLVFVIGSFVMTILVRGIDMPLLTSIGAVATCLGNVGPAIGSLGPVDNFSALGAEPKVFLSIIMIIGRLELFTVLLLLTPYFWRNN